MHINQWTVHREYTDYQLNIDDLSVNVIHTQPDDNTLSHCPTLIQYVLKVKNSKHKLTAMLGSGRSGVSGISSDRVAHLARHFAGRHHAVAVHRGQ